MADKIYVGVEAVVKDAFDKKYKSTLPKPMKAAIEKVINSSSKLTTKPAPDKNTKGFYVTASLVSMTKDEKSKPPMLAAQASLAVATWPEMSMFAFAKGSAKEQLGNPSKIDADVQGLAEDLMEDVTKSQVIKTLENKKP